VIVKFRCVPYAYKLKNNLKLEEEGIYIFCGILDPAAVQDCKIFPSYINVLLQLVRDIINGVCNQRYENRVEQQKGRPNVNLCATEENVEEEL